MEKLPTRLPGYPAMPNNWHLMVSPRYNGGLAASVHDADDLEQAIEAFARTLRMLKEEGDA